MPESPAPSVAVERTLDGLLGLEILELGGDRARARVEVSDRVRQPLGLVHGGAYAAIAESLASQGTMRAVWDEQMVAVGLSNHTSFMRRLSRGTIHADAVPRHRGRTTWVWEVELTDDQGRLCALSRVTMAVRPREGLPPDPPAHAPLAGRRTSADGAPPQSS